MRVIGFHFDKISAEKLKEKAANLKINTSIDISDVTEIKTDVLKTKEVLLQAKFSYSINYEPNFANIDLKGTVILALEEKQADEVLKEYKKKMLPGWFKMTVLNLVMRKSTLKSLQLEEEINLPIHMPLPSLRSSGKEKEK